MPPDVNINLKATDGASPEIQQATLNIVRMQAATEAAQQAAERFGQTKMVPADAAAGTDALTQSFQNFVKAEDQVAQGAAKAAGGMDSFNLSMIASVAAGFGLATSVQAVVSELVSVGTESALLADAMNAMHNRASVIFGTDMPQMASGAVTLGQAYGRSSTEILGFETNLTALGTGFGLTQKAAEGMSGQMAALAVDIGKVYQESDDQALSRLESALMGNVRALRDLQIPMSTAVLNQYLLSQGYDRTITSLDAESQAQVRLHYLLEHGHDIHVIAIKDTGNLDDETKRLTATWQDLERTMGQSIAPTVAGEFAQLDDVILTTEGKVATLTGAFAQLFGLLGIKGGGGGSIGASLGTALDASLTALMPAEMGALHGLEGLWNSIPTTAGGAAGGVWGPNLIPGVPVQDDGSGWLGGLTGKGSGGGAKKAASELKALQDQMTSLGDTYDNEVLKVNDNLASLEIAHRDKLRSIDDQIETSAQKIGSLGEAYHQTMEKMVTDFNDAVAKLNGQEADKVVEQVRKVEKMQADLDDIVNGKGALNTDTVVSVMANRQDKTGAYETRLSEKDKETFHLTDQNAKQVELVMQLQKERESLKGYLDEKGNLSGDLKASLDNSVVGSPEFDAVLDQIVKSRGDLSKANTKAGGTDFDRNIGNIDQQRTDGKSKFDQKAKDEADRFHDQMDKAQQEVGKLKEKKQAEIDSYSAQREQMLQSKVALTEFHDHYVTMLDDMTKVTKEQVKAMTDGLKDLTAAIAAANSSTKKGGTTTPSGGLQKFASGGISSGGYALVGEEGPELVALPGGSRVYNSQDSQKMMGGQQVTVNLGPVYVSKEVDGDALISRITRAIQLQNYASAPA